MKAIVLGAGGPREITAAMENPRCMLYDTEGVRVLDWILRALRENSVDDICFVGGYRIEEIARKYPDLRYCYNTNWQFNNVLDSLLYAEREFDSEFLCTYSDIVYFPDSVRTLLDARQGDLTLMVDPQWKTRYHNRTREDQLQAEKIWRDRQQHLRFGKSIDPSKEVLGEFIGLCWFSEKAAEYLRKNVSELRRNYDSRRFHEARNIHSAFLTDLFQEMAAQGLKIVLCNVEGRWAELNSPQDIAQFIFGSKAETLQRIRPIVKKGQLCDQIHFSIHDWQENKPELLKQIATKFAGQKIIVRSSSLKEDSWQSSQAGAFKSVANIAASENGAVEEAIEEVIASFEGVQADTRPEDDQVLVQPFIQNVQMSGVIFTRQLDTGAPYFILNYDDESNRTDTITSGSTNNIKTVTIYKKSRLRHRDERINRLVAVARELEEITGLNALDIEFAVSQSGEVFILQVRPLTIHTSLSENEFNALEDILFRLKSFVAGRYRKYPHVYGNKTVLGDMTDWNPAEMIGTHPNPLALSLYQYLITDSAWREARAAIGYMNPIPEKLLYCLGGHPYIDVRNSMNNLTPQGLRPELAEKLLNHYINRLIANPHLHDKIEFDIVITCLTPDFEDHAQRLRDDGFSAAEVDELKERLRVLTENILSEQVHPIDGLLQKTELLNQRRRQFLANDYSPQDIPSIIALLLLDCIHYGTIPFSILARYGFIAASMLRGLVARGVIDESQKHEFLSTIETIAGRMVADLNRVANGQVSLADFLKEYGHLRPGTYDILSYSYEEQPGIYFSIKPGGERAAPAASSPAPASFQFPDDILHRMDEELRRLNLNIGHQELLAFIRKAIPAREYAKFQFTKNVSAVLSLIEELGEAFGFSRQEMSYLFIEDILKLEKVGSAASVKGYLESRIREGREWAESFRSVETPHLVFTPDDFEIVESQFAQPNFVTKEVVVAPVCLVSSGIEKEELKGKIALIEGADPGYDWIFLYDIKGLITKYGGAASHMTIRCAEFGLPAAIGCGEELYRQISRARNIELNCLNKQVRALA